MCTVTSRRVRCGCTVWLLTTLGECGLSLSLGLRPIKTHSINYKMRNNQCVCWVSLELGCRRPVVLSKRSCMGVRDPWHYPKMFCTGVRDLWYYPKSSVWVLETRGMSRKVQLPKENTRSCLSLRLRVE